MDMGNLEWGLVIVGIVVAVAVLIPLIRRALAKWRDRLSELS